MFLFIQYLVAFWLLKSTLFILNQKLLLKNSIFNLLFGSIIVVHLLALLLTIKNITKPYLYWSQLGFGTMFKNNNAFYFGDLAHVLSAVNCDSQVAIGNNVCDPFDRSFNQNPHIVHLFRTFQLENLFVVGSLYNLP